MPMKYFTEFIELDRFHERPSFIDTNQTGKMQYLKKRKKKVKYDHIWEKGSSWLMSSGVACRQNPAWVLPLF